MGERGGRGNEPYNSKIAWPSMNRSILSGQKVHRNRIKGERHGQLHVLVQCRRMTRNGVTIDNRHNKSSGVFNVIKVFKIKSSFSKEND
jgi:hypothetical protein